MSENRSRPWTLLLLPVALLLGAGALLLPGPDPGPAATPAPARGDPFVAAGADTTGAPRVLLPDVHAVSDAVETGDGWILLDDRNERIHALGRGGTLRWSAGGEGRGPGELLRPVALTVVDSTVVVVDGRGTALDRFDLGGGFVDRTPLRVPDCIGGLVRGIAPWSDGAVLLLRLCLDPSTGRMDARADRIGADGASTTLAALRLKNLRRPGADLLAEGVLGALQPRVYLGTTSDLCVRAFRAPPGGAGSEVDALPPLCLPERDAVPVPEEARRRTEEALARRPLARVLGFRLPDNLPPFDRIFPSDGGLVFRTLTSIEGRSLVRVGSDGRVEPLAVPANASTFVGRRSVLVSWQELEGTALRVAELADTAGAR